MDYFAKRIALVLAVTLSLLFGTFNAALAWNLTGTIYGGGSPLSNATVTLKNAATSSQLGIVNTDGAGVYSFTVDDGTYNLVVSPPSGSGFSESLVKDISVSGADVTQNVVLIAQAVTISGTVRYPDGTVAPNIQVYASGASAQTDSAGKYSLAVSAGTHGIDVYGGTGYGAQAKASPYQYNFQPTSSLSVTTNVTYDITLPEFVAISGNTTDANGTPLANARLYMSGTSVYIDGKYYYIYGQSAYSDASGAYSMVVLPYSSYSFTLYPPSGNLTLVQKSYSSVSVTSATTRDFALANSSILSGTVRFPDGTVAPNVVIYAYGSGGAAGGNSRTDAAGNYSIAVSPGTFYLDLYAGNAYGTQGKPSPSQYYHRPVTGLSVTADTICDITLPTFVTISGKTTDINGAGVAGVQLSRSYVSFQDANGKSITAYGESVYSNATGAYSMIVIPHGAYSFTAYPPSGNTSVVQTTYSSVNVTSDTTRDFALSKAIALSGTVRYADGTAAPNFNVRANGYNGAMGGSVYTDANGRYVMAVSEGTFSVGGYGGRAYGSQPKPAPYQFSIMSPPSFTYSADATHDITLPEFATISGKTTDANGAPVSNVRVYTSSASFTGSDGNQYYNYSQSVYSEANTGAYSMVVLPYNNYTMTVYPTSGSGFVQTTVNGINITSNVLQNWAMAIPDTTPPNVDSGPTVTATSSSTATITLTTNEPTRCEIVYGIGEATGNSVSETDYAKPHALQLTGLLADTTYYFKVNVNDLAGNLVTTKTYAFTTTALRDTLPPVFTDSPRAESIDATTAVITWSTNEPTTGKVSYGSTEALGSALLEPNVSASHSVKLTGLAPETTYYFEVGAVDTAGNGATISGVKSFTTLAVADTTLPTLIDGPTVISVSETSATILWSTDEPSTSGVSWNTDGRNYGVTQDPALVQKHVVTISGLISGTTYTFTVSSVDGSGNGPLLKTSQFITLQAADDKPPVFLRHPYAKSITDTAAVISWRTDEGTSSYLKYGTNPYALDQVATTNYLLTLQRRSIVDLLPGKTYYMQVVAKDLSGNVQESQIGSFTTRTTPVTLPPLIVKAPVIAYSSDQTAVVTFSTDTACNAYAFYGVSATSLTNQAFDGNGLATEHQLFLTNLVPETPYLVRVRCADVYGRVVTASAGTPLGYFAAASGGSDADPLPAPELGFTTKGQPDQTAPSLTASPRVAAVDNAKAVIALKVDELTNAKVFHQVKGAGNPVFGTDDLVKDTDHTVTLTNLAASTEYEYHVQVTDPSDNTSTSSVYSFTTPAAPDLTAPAISDLAAEGVSLSRVRLTWNTDEPATTMVKYGTSPASLTLQADVSGLSTAHDITLYNLVPGTTYYFAPVSADSSNNSAQGAATALTLAGAPPTIRTVTAKSGTGGTVSPASRTAYEGYAVSLAVLPDPGYLLGTVTGCGGTITGNVYTTAPLAADCQVSATFAADPSYNAGVTPSTRAYPAGGSYAAGTLLAVELRSSRPTASIYYTTDGSSPTTSSPLYSKPITVKGTTTLKYFAQDAALAEEVKTSTYTFAADASASPSFNGLKNGGTFTVLRSEGGGQFVPVVSDSTSTSYTDSSILKPNTVYQYAVTSDTDPSQTLFMSLRSPLYDGWNIVAVPSVATGTLVANVFNNTLSTVAEWIPSGPSAEESNNQLGYYVHRSTLEAGRGYFAKATGSTSLVSAGSADIVSSTILLRPGWTMIANPTPRNLVDISTNWLVNGKPLASAILAGQVAGGIYWWNGTTYDSWSILGDNPEIQPWKGYWILNPTYSYYNLTIQ